MTADMQRDLQQGRPTPGAPGNRRTALVLASIALVFFAGVVIRHWLW